MIAKVTKAEAGSLHNVAALVPGIIFSYDIKKDRLTLYSEKYIKFAEGVVIEKWTEYFKSGNVVYSGDFICLAQFLMDISTENRAIETRIRANIFGNGHRLLALRAKKVELCGKVLVVGTIIDVNDINNESDRRTKSYLLEEKAVKVDEVTGLLKYKEFITAAQQSLEQVAGHKSIGKRVAMYADFSNFKYINTIYGYEIGDRMLAEYAQTIRDRIPNAYVHCRSYADNFISFADVPDEEYIVNSLRKINESFQNRQNMEYPLGNIQVYTGVYFLANEEIDIKSAIDNANTARKFAKKRQIPGCMVYNTEINKIKEQDIHITASFRRALKNGELQVFLQPKVSLSSTDLIGAEALIRWIRSDGSITYPDDFIPVLERNGQIVDLDYYVFEKVCQMMCIWRNDNKRLCPVSVNFSRVHIFQGELAEKLEKMTAKYNLPNDLFEVEITETAFSYQHERLIYMIDALREVGFKVSIDDFGSGYSSLKMLTEVAANVVKMDREFIKDYDMSSQKKNIIKETIHLAKAAEMEVIFEGVENEEQVNLLKDAGCDSVQGYFFAKPMPVSDFERLWLNRLRMNVTNVIRE